jgi:hypothetical protein
MNYEFHGYRYHPIYLVWKGMKQRCYNSNYNYYKHYGGRGIKVCDEWKNSAKSFIEWCLNNGWKPGLEIDREDNNGDYCSENCRFITHKENMHNQELLRNTNTSGYRGVCYVKNKNKWVAQITINNEVKHLGYFNSSELAAIAYDNAVPDNRPRNFKFNI